MPTTGVIMANYIPSNFFVPGFKAAGISAGIKKVQAKDLALLYSETPAVAAGVFVPWALVVLIKVGWATIF